VHCYGHLWCGNAIGQKRIRIFWLKYLDRINHATESIVNYAPPKLDILCTFSSRFTTNHIDFVIIITGQIFIECEVSLHLSLNICHIFAYIMQNGTEGQNLEWEMTYCVPGGILSHTLFLEGDYSMNHESLLGTSL